MAKKILILIGPFAGYADSFGIFSEHGYKVFVKVISTLPCFEHNYEVFKELGFTLALSDEELVGEVKNYVEGDSVGSSMIISGTEFYGDDIYNFDVSPCTQELESYQSISKQLKKSGIPLLSVRFSCGETFFTSRERAQEFESLNQHTDAFVTHNPVTSYYIKHHCPSLANKLFLNRPIHSPLRRYTRTFLQKNIEKRYLLLGRRASTAFPKRTMPVDEYSYLTNPLYLATSANLKGLQENRRKAMKELSSHALGIGHFYDFFENDKASLDEIIKDGSLPQSIAYGGAKDYNLPRIFRSANVAGKVITYLMLGIVPLIPNDPTNLFHQMLIRNQMAIPVESSGKYSDISAQQLLNMRMRILSGVDLFTFDPTFFSLDALGRSRAL